MSAPSGDPPPYRTPWWPVPHGVIGTLFAFLLLKFGLSWSAWFALPLAKIAGVLFATYSWFSVRNYVNQVEDSGTHLVARRGGTEEIISFDDIDCVESSVLRPAGITLHLNRDSRFGRRIKYHPDAFPWGIPKEAERIRKRCPVARYTPGCAGD